MNYEQVYKETRRWIESIYPELGHEKQMLAEKLFPKLKESKDILEDTILDGNEDMKPGQLFTYNRRVWRVSKKVKGLPCFRCDSRNGFKPCKKDSSFPCIKRCGLHSHPILVK